MVVVFPVPFIPTKTITYGSFSVCFFSAISRRSTIGVWKISKLHAYFVLYTDFQRGWGVTYWALTAPEVDLPPDRKPSARYDYLLIASPAGAYFSGGSAMKCRRLRSSSSTLNEVSTLRAGKLR